MTQNVPVPQPEPIPEPDAPDVAPEPTAEPDEPEQVPLTARAITLAVATVAIALVGSAAALLPVPYVISSPGPTWDTLGEDDGTPLVSVDGAPTFEPTGRLLLTTVSVSGGPGRDVALLDLLGAWLDPARSSRPVETVFDPDQTREQIDQQNQASMITSQENATVAALEELGYEVPTTLTVADAVEGTGAEGVVRPDDVLLAVGGVEVGSFSELSREVDAIPPGQTTSVTVERDGERTELDLRTTEGPDGSTLLGVLIDPTFDFPLDVEIRIEDVGGPSAGTMFALAVIDLLTEADETGGETIAGTGTVDLEGTVGPIGGVRQKMAGAVADGAAWFLAPVGNCDEVTGHVPAGLEVAAVGTLAEARAAVAAIGEGRVADLPRC